MDGRYLLVSNDWSLSHYEMFRLYRAKDGVETCFHIGKDDLALSPLYLHLDQRIASMIFVNIVGFMHFWGLSIDSVTVIMLVIALGLAVDYSAHIGRAYLEKRGTPDERIVRTLEDMGVAVWNGAMSTFMAVMILGSSSSYVFMTFFKQLFLCITLGLAHGLIFLPVLLSLLKPAPYAEGIDRQILRRSPRARAQVCAHRTLPKLIH